MAILTDDMKRVVNEQRPGFVATVCVDGSPNLSPKGTMVVLDHEHIAFGAIRSPNTIGNLAERPMTEVNFVDPIARTGYRFKGPAEVVRRGDPAFEALLPAFERALPLTSPAYDAGASEHELRASWLRHFQDLQPD